MKKSIPIIFAAAVAACIIAGVASFFACEPTNHTLEADFSLPEGEIMHGATGWLYGIAEDEVPSSDLLVPLSPQIACVKAPDGKQHPVGDVLNVAETFLRGDGKYLFVYMQDIYPDWYYKYEGQADYVEKAEEMTRILAAQPYADRLIYCPFNESDNGEWYGDLHKKENMEKFYADWSAVYSAIRAVHDGAFIAGPGFMKYDGELFRSFYELCRKGGNAPDMAVWHELSSDSYRKFDSHYEDYRAAEKQAGMEPLPICISEYGQMSDNGIPGKTMQYISAFESKKVYACIAYWRLADNLGELAADAVSPTGAWWVYRWYAQMSGNTFSFENMNGVASRVRGVAAMQDDGCVLLVGGGSGEIKIKLKNLPFDDGAVYATTEYTEYDGLGAECTAPLSGGCAELSVKDGSATLIIPDAREDRAYRITLSADGSAYAAEENERLEAENARLTNEDGRKIGITRVDDVAYACSGGIAVIPKGGELTFTYTSASEKEALLQICYANGRTRDGERVNLAGTVTVNGQRFPVTFENTLSDAVTTALTMRILLKEGENTVCLSAEDEFAADFIDISSLPAEEYRVSAAGGGRYFAVVPESGFYTPAGGAAGIYGQTENTRGTLFLKKGVNILSSDGASALVRTDGEAAILTGGYSSTFSDVKYVTGEENAFVFATPALKGGVYALTLFYSNNAEDGRHDYNVELAERYAQIYVNKTPACTAFFRNTYAWDNFKSATFYLTLDEGVNEIRFSCNGEYAPATGQAAFLPVFAARAYLAEAAR